MPRRAIVRRDEEGCLDRGVSLVKRELRDGNILKIGLRDGRSGRSVDDMSSFVSEGKIMLWCGKVEMGFPRSERVVRF